MGLIEEMTKVDKALKTVHEEIYKLKGDNSLHKLKNTITEILIKSIYYAAYGSGETAEEINTWEDRAVFFYHHDTKFNAVISQQAALIMKAVQDYLK